MSDLGTVNTPLDFDALEAAESKLKKAITDWPLPIQVGAAWLTMALKNIGLQIEIDPPHPGEYLDKLIELVEASPSTGYGKWLALAALRFVHRYVHPDHNPKVFAKLAKYGAKGVG